MTRNVRADLLQRRVTLGTWIQTSDAATAEILANAGFDWIAADCEHTAIDIGQFTALARGMHGRGAAPLARVRENDTLAIRRVLDMGATGVIVPLVDTAEQAEHAVQAAKYPPRGIRGFSFSRANEWGVCFREYCQSANENIAVIAMVESKEAVENIDEILAVEGIDGVFVGPYDMTGSYGKPGETDAPEIQKALKQVVEACEKAGKAAGQHVVIPEEKAIQRAVDSGFTFIALGMDTVFLDQGARRALSAPCLER